MSITTARKLAANRANAAASTGPRTPQGKRRAACNALKHGLFSQAALIPGEDPEELAEFRTAMLECLRPRDVLQGILADRVISETWRLRRAVAYEGQVIEHRGIEERSDRKRLTGLYDGRPPLHEGQIVNDLLASDVLSRLSRYEQRIERSMYRALSELQRLQSRPLPAARADAHDGDGEDDSDAQDLGGAEDGCAAEPGAGQTCQTKPRAENCETGNPGKLEGPVGAAADTDGRAEDEAGPEQAMRQRKPRAENSEFVVQPQGADGGDVAPGGGAGCDAAPGREGQGEAAPGRAAFLSRSRPRPRGAR